MRFMWRHDTQQNDIPHDNTLRYKTPHSAQSL